MIIRKCLKSIWYLSIINQSFNHFIWSTIHHYMIYRMVFHDLAKWKKLTNHPISLNFLGISLTQNHHLEAQVVWGRELITGKIILHGNLGPDLIGKMVGTHQISPRFSYLDLRLFDANGTSSQTKIPNGWWKTVMNPLVESIKSPINKPKPLKHTYWATFSYNS